MMIGRKLGVVAAFAALVAMAGPVLAHDEAQEENEGSKVAMKDVPAPVKATIDAQAKGGKVWKVTKEEEGGKTTYEAAIGFKSDKGKRKVEVEVAADGTLIATEEFVKLADTPAPVKAKIAELSKGKKVQGIEKRTEGATVTFEVRIKGTKEEIVLASDGTVQPAKP
jgi:hypothetical protein